MVVFAERLIKVFGEVVGIAVFCISPSVVHFIHHQHAKFVTGFQQYFAWGIVAGTDCITAHFFQDFYLTVNGVAVSCSAESALVMVHTYAFHLHLRSV